MARNYYSEVIDVLSDGTVDLSALIRQVAKTNPSAVVNAYISINAINAVLGTPKPLDPIYGDGVIEQYCRNDRKLSAIKEHRARTGFGLSESKGAIDRLCLDIGLNH